MLPAWFGPMPYVDILSLYLIYLLLPTGISPRKPELNPDPASYKLSPLRLLPNILGKNIFFPQYLRVPTP